MRPPNAAPRARPSTVAELRDMLMAAEDPHEPERMAAFRTRASDVFIATYPKCGTTWMQEICHSLRTKGHLDFAEISLVVPWVERSSWLGIDPDGEQVAEPRLFKTHYSWDLVPKGGRYIYVMRHPHDALVSFYHFFNGWMFERDAIDLPSFARGFFLAGSLSGRYWEHLHSWWSAATTGDSEILLLCYEDLKRDLTAQVRRIAAFLHLDGLDDGEERVAIAAEQASYAFMRAHEKQFDDHPTTAVFNQVLGLPSDGKTSKIGTGTVGRGAMLSDELRAELDAEWHNVIGGPLGIADYDALRTLANRA